jgi:hypothetical protein
MPEATSGRPRFTLSSKPPDTENETGTGETRESAPGTVRSLNGRRSLELAAGLF